MTPRWEGTLMTAASHGAQPTEAPCPCGHTAGEHDALASRYCLATAAGGLDRGCMCALVVQVSGLVPR
jgi:hypothetical protein